MAYQTGTSSGGADLLAKFRLFAAAQGWGVNSANVGFGGNNRWVHFNDAEGNHADFVWDGQGSVPQNEVGTNPAEAGMLYLQGSAGYDGSILWNLQPNASLIQQVDLGLSDFPGYWFFGDSQGIMCVVEVSTGMFRHFGFGKLIKIGAYTGGFWVAGSTYRFGQSTTYNWGPFDASMSQVNGYHPTQLRIAFEGKEWWTASRYDVMNAAPPRPVDGRALWTVRNGMEDTMLYRTPNTMNAITPLIPIRAFVSREQSQLVSPVGTVRNIRSVNLALLSPRDEIVLGTDRWKVFPISRKVVFNTTPTFNQGSGDVGYAYKVVQ